MTTGDMGKITYKYCARFGQLAVELGFITKDQLIDAFRCQIDDKLFGQKHRLVGRVLLDKGLMTSDQVEQVMNMLLKNMRLEEADHKFKFDSDLSPITLPGESNGQHYEKSKEDAHRT